MTPGLAAYCIIIGGLFLVIWKRPAVVLAGVFCMFGLEQWGQATTPFLAKHQAVTNLVIGSLLALAMIVQLAKRGVAVFAGYPVVGWLTLLLFSYAFLSIQWAPRPDLSLKLWAGAWPYIITLIVLSPLMIVNGEDLRLAYKALVLCGGFLAPLLMFAVPWEGRQIVLGDALGSPLPISAMAGMIVIILVLADPWKGKKFWLPMKWVLTAICLAMIVRSGSRGQLFSLLVVTILCWPIGNGLSNPRQFAVLACLVGFLGATAGWALETFWSEEQHYYAGGSRWSGQAMEGAMEGRFNAALFLVEQCYHSIECVLFGLGNSAAFDPRLLGIYPHFVPLEVLAEEGVIAFAIYSTIFIVTAHNCSQSYRLLAEAPEQRPLLGALVALFLFSTMLSLKQGSLLGNLEPFMFAILLGKYRFFLWQFQVSDGQGTQDEGSVNCTMATYSEVSCLRT